jgi:hypothetical protein
MNFGTIYLTTLSGIPDNTHSPPAHQPTSPHSPPAHQPTSPPAHQPTSPPAHQRCGRLGGVCYRSGIYNMVHVNQSIKSILAGVGVVLATVLPSTGFASFTPEDDPCEMGTSCMQRYACTIRQCNANFDPGTPPDMELVYALDACKRGAEIRAVACETAPVGLLTSTWFDFIADLQFCKNNYGVGGPEEDEDDLYRCYETALALFQERISNFPTNDSCGEGTVPRGEFGFPALMPMQALESAAIAAGQLNGKYPVDANSTLVITAGVNAAVGSSYDVRQMPCIKNALLVSIYQTKAGVVVNVEDADLDTSDGVQFDIHVIAEKVVDAADITLISVYFDENFMPQFAELGTLEIQDSPISGDWNRDEVLNTQDVIDFLASYDAQTKRADINNDTQVTPQDAVEFINSTP